MLTEEGGKRGKGREQKNTLKAQATTATTRERNGLSPRYGYYLTHSTAISPPAVAAMDSCFADYFALIGAHQHSIAAAVGSIGSLRCHYGDGNDNVKKAIGLGQQNNNFARASRFLYISLPSLHDYDVNCLISRFIDNVNIRRRISLGSL